MAMVCRRCGGEIGPGEIANVIHSVIVGECCRRADERGYDEDAVEVMPSRGRASEPIDPNGPEPLNVTERRVEVMQLAEDGLVIKEGNRVNAFDPKARVMRDSKTVTDLLRYYGLVYWEQIPPQGFMRETKKWKLRLTNDGRDWLAAAEGVLSAECG